jgi:hypothetical protein
MSELQRLGCESCGTRSGCRCHLMRTCASCGFDFFPKDPGDEFCHECEASSQEDDDDES